MSSKSSITEGSIIKPLLFFFFPILFGTFFQQLYNTVDALVIGNFLGKEALAAVGGTTGVYLNLFVGFFTGLGSGATVLVSQFFGMNNYNRISRTVHTSITISIVFGILLTFLIFTTSKTALTILGVPLEILDMSMEYIEICSIGLVSMMLYNMGCSILRAVGDSKHPLYFLIVSCIVNIVLDILFVYKFSMGVKGVALATIIAQSVSAFLVILSLIKSDDALHLNLKELSIDKSILKDSFRIGLPAGIQSVLYTISNLLITSAINSFGVNAIAANTAFGKIDDIFWMIDGAFGVAITTFVGQNYGAGKMERVSKGNNQWMIIATVISICISLVCIFFAPNLLGLFNSDPEVIAIGKTIIQYVAPFWITFIPIEILSGTLRGMGDSFIPTVITAIGIVGIRVIWIFYMPDTSFITVFMVYPISWIITSLVFIIYYYSGIYKKHLKRA